MTTPGKLHVGPAGYITGPARIDYNSPWPCANGTPGGGSQHMMGVVMHTMVGDLPGTVAWFNDPASQVSAFFGIAQDGLIHQFGPIGKNWEAWAQAVGNPEWYSFEFADDGDPANPLTAEQITAAAQLLECLATFAAFPLDVTDSVQESGLGWHGMGGMAWGDHPLCPGDVRKAQRPAIIALAKEIRAGVAPPPPPLLEGILVELPGGASRKVLSSNGGKTWSTNPPPAGADISPASLGDEVQFRPASATGGSARPVDPGYEFPAAHDIAEADDPFPPSSRPRPA